MKLQQFYAALISTYPDVNLNGEFTPAQANYAKTATGVSLPAAVWQNRVSRGVYKIPDEFRNGITQSANEQQTNNDTIVTSRPQMIETPAIRTFIPTRDTTFVPFGAYSDIDDIIQSRIFYPVYITGLSGNGKSLIVEQVCAKRKREMIRVNLNAMSDEEQLVGSKTLKDGNVEIVEGPVLIAMRRGAVLLIDELDAGSANALMCIQSILEGKPYYFKLKNEIIVPTPGFNILATANTKGTGDDNGKYIGTNILNEAFLERFGATFEQEYPSQKVELKIILNKMEKFNCVDESFASCLSKWADAIRKTYDAGGVDEIVSTRRIVHIITAFSVFKDKRKAVELCCNRFDTQTKLGFISMFDAISPDESAGVVVDASTLTQLTENNDEFSTLAAQILSTPGTPGTSLDPFYIVR